MHHLGLDPEDFDLDRGGVQQPIHILRDIVERQSSDEGGRLGAEGEQKLRSARAEVASQPIDVTR